MVSNGLLHTQSLFLVTEENYIGVTECILTKIKNKNAGQYVPLYYVTVACFVSCPETYHTFTISCTKRYSNTEQKVGSYAPTPRNSQSNSPSFFSPKENASSFPIRLHTETSRKRREFILQAPFITKQDDHFFAEELRTSSVSYSWHHQESQLRLDFNHIKPCWKLKDIICLHPPCCLLTHCLCHLGCKSGSSPVFKPDCFQYE